MKLDPKMTVVRFESEDVIAASSRTVVLSKFTDTDKTNNTFSFGGNDYVIKDDPPYHAFRADLSNYVGDPGISSHTGSNIIFGEKDVNHIYRQKVDGFDGTYVYNGTGTYKFTKKQ